MLVTGASGFTGRHLARELMARGARVRVLARRADSVADLSLAGAEVVQGDVKSRESLERAVAGTSIVFHVAALFRQASQPASEYRAVNAESPPRLVEVAAAAGVRRVLHCSTIGVHGDADGERLNEDAPFNPYDVYQETKLEGELRARESAERLGVPLTVVRPATIYGPGDQRMLKLFAGVVRRRFPMIGSGKVLLHPIYVDDLVEGMLLAASSEAAVGRTYILGGRDALPLNDIVSTVADLAGVEPPRIHFPVWPFWLAGAVCEAVCVPLRLEPPIFRRRVAFFTKSRAFDCSRARAELGYVPLFSWRQGAERTLNWYRQAGWI